MKNKKKSYKKNKELKLNISKFKINDYMSPGCHCNMEDKIKKKFKNLSFVSINPMTNDLTIKSKFNKMPNSKIIKFLKKCGYDCESKNNLKTSNNNHSSRHELNMDLSNHKMNSSNKDMPMSNHKMKMSKHKMNMSNHKMNTTNKKMNMSDHNMNMTGEEHKNHSNHHAMMAQDFKKRTLVSLIFTFPVLFLSPTIQDWFNLPVLNFAGSDLLLFALASIIVFYGAWPFYKGSVKSMKSGILDMNVLVSLAVLSGYLYSVGSTFIFVAADFYWEISTLVLFLTFGHWMEMRAVIGASGALGELVKLIPPKAFLVKGNDVLEVETKVLKVGDIILVKPGGKIPIDGLVISGESSVNESMITGESKPITKKKGDKLIGGSVNQSGALKFKVNKVGEDTALAQIINLVKSAQESKPKTQKLADRAAHYLTLIAIIVGISTFVFWTFFSNAGVLFALTLAITVVVIACPHALGLAIPTVTSISTTLAAKSGMLIKDMKAMEIAKNLDIVVFDKTGTLTKGEFGVTDIVSFGSWSADKILKLSAALEISSEHVIGKGIVNKAKSKKLSLPKISVFSAIPGKGAKAKVGTTQIFIGNERLMNSLKISISSAKEKLNKLSAQGKTVIFVASKKRLEGIIALADIVRPESKQAVKLLNKLGVEVAMLTGDNELTAKYVAKQLGLSTYFAEVQPGDKNKKIKELQAQGKKVAMVGDGINDAPALTQADIGIAIGAGTDVAIASAEIILIKNNPKEIAELIRLSKATMAKMNQNLIWATAYNAIAIPVATGIFSKWNLLLKPEWAALIMAGSSIIVVSNALLLKSSFNKGK